MAKLAHENATRAFAPGPRVLRAAQFMQFPDQMLTWCRDGEAVMLPVMPTQPVTVEEIARALVDLADGTDLRDQAELAGPKAENLADLVRQVAAHRGEDIAVTTTVASRAMAAGACLPGPEADLAGPDFSTWLNTMTS